MPELTAGQIADLRALRDHCLALGADPVIIAAIAHQVHFPGELRHTGDIDSAVGLDLDEFAELERSLQTDGWIRFANREHRWRSAQGTFMDLHPAGPKLRAAKQVTWRQPVHMSLVRFEHVFTDAQPVEFSPDLTLNVISSTALMLLKIVAFMDDPLRRVKDLDDIPGHRSNIHQSMARREGRDRGQGHEAQEAGPRLVVDGDVSCNAGDPGPRRGI
jgi:predicted nucleotidyltransferase